MSAQSEWLVGDWRRCDGRLGVDHRLTWSEEMGRLQGVLSQDGVEVHVRPSSVRQDSVTFELAGSPAKAEFRKVDESHAVLRVLSVDLLDKKDLPPALEAFRVIFCREVSA
jgi:hypothetical protein